MIIEGLKKRLWWKQQERRKVDTRVATCHLGAQDSAVQSHRTNTVLPCLRLWSYLTGRYHVEITKDWNVQWRQGGRSKAVRARLCRRGSLHRSCSVSMILAGDPAISRLQHERTIIQYRQFGPTLRPRRVRLTQAQLEVGRIVRRQTGYKTGVVSTTIPRGPRRPKFLEHSEPAQVLPMRRHAGISVLLAPRRPFFFQSNLEATCHKYGM
jgi:hypothetical protein